MEAVEYRVHGADGVGEPTRTINTMSQQEFDGDTPWAGATGVIDQESKEVFAARYGKTVVYVRPDTKLNRVDGTLEFKTIAGAQARLAKDAIAAAHRRLPVLIKARSVNEAHHIYGLLLKAGLKRSPNLLTTEAEYLAQENDILAQAGVPGQVTVSTNMIGRGTDIKLGGDAEKIIELRMRELGLTPDTPKYDSTLEMVEAGVRRTVGKNVADLNVEGRGLQVFGLGESDSPRTEFQWRGRAGRKGEHGLSRLYRSQEDEAVRNPAGVRVRRGHGPGRAGRTGQGRRGDRPAVDRRRGSGGPAAVRGEPAWRVGAGRARHRPRPKGRAAVIDQAADRRAARDHRGG